MYEQHENHENALRCPVKLYEFYLSKVAKSTFSPARAPWSDRCSARQILLQQMFIKFEILYYFNQPFSSARSQLRIGTTCFTFSPSGAVYQTVRFGTRRTFSTGRLGVHPRESKLYTYSHWSRMILCKSRPQYRNLCMITLLYIIHMYLYIRYKFIITQAATRAKF